MSEPISWEDVYQGTPRAAADRMAADSVFDSSIRSALLDIDPATLERDYAGRMRKLFLETAIAIRDNVGSP